MAGEHGGLHMGLLGFLYESSEMFMTDDKRKRRRGRKRKWKKVKMKGRRKIRKRGRKEGQKLQNDALQLI